MAARSSRHFDEIGTRIDCIFYALVEKLKPSAPKLQPRSIDVRLHFKQQLEA